MAVILSITPERFHMRIEFDDESALSVRKKDIAGLAICIGMETDPESLCGRICAYQLDDGYEAALCILDVCARTEKEIRQKLLFKGYLPPVIDAVISRLKDARLLDDDLIAARLVQSAARSGKGRYVIRQKLRARGIDPDACPEALEPVDEEQQAESCLAQAQKLIKKYAGADARAAKAKLSQALARRGFSWQSIEYALERLDINED